MCLRLSTTQPPVEARIVYKIFERGQRTGIYYSLFRGMPFDDLQPNGFIQSSRVGTALTYGEKLNNEVLEGFHSFSNQETAQRYISQREADGYQSANLKLAEFCGEPEHFVGAGTYSYGYDSEVYTRLTFLRFIPVIVPAPFQYGNKAKRK